MEQLTFACAWCSGDDAAVPLPAKLEAPKPSGPVTHGICTDCYHAALADLEPAPTDPVWGVYVDLGGEG